MTGYASDDESRRIDWRAIRERLAVTAAAISGAGMGGHSPEDEQLILTARARAQARTPDGRDEGEQLDILAFDLARETYGVELDHVREVCQLRELTSIPCAPPFLAGVMSLRGRVLPIVDLRWLFDLPAKGITELNRVVVVANAATELGLLADAVLGVRQVLAEALHGDLPTLTDLREAFLRGVTAEMLIVLDGARLLADPRLRVDDRPARASGAPRPKNNPAEKR